MLKMQMLDEDDELAYSTSSAPEEQEKKEADGRPTWMRQLHTSLATWLQLVPKVRLLNVHPYLRASKAILKVQGHIN